MSSLLPEDNLQAFLAQARTAPRHLGTPSEPCLYLVSQGAVDIFLSKLDAQGQRQALHPLCRIEAGQVFLWSSLPTALQAYQLHCAALPDSHLHPVDENAWRLLPIQWLEKAIADWFAALLHASHSQLLPPRHTLLEAGDCQDLPANTIASSATARLWLQVQSGSLAFLGDPENLLTAGQHLCLHANAWVSANTTSQVQSLEFASLCTELEQLQQIVQAQQQALLKACVAHILANQQQTQLRMQQRQEGHQRHLATALGELAGILDEHKHSPTRQGDPLEAACQLIGQALGIQFMPLATSSLPSQMSLDDRINQMASAAQVQKRRVALRGNWWQADAGPLLARGLATDEEQLWVLLPRNNQIARAHARRLRPSGFGHGGSQYLACDASKGEWHIVDAAFAEQLAPFAHTFLRALPGHKLKMRDLLRAGLYQRRPELLCLLGSGALLGLLGMLAPLATGYLFDQIIPSSQRHQLAQLCGALFGVALASLFFSILRAQVLLRLETQMNGNIQAAIWDRVLKLPLSFFRSYTAGDLAQRINAINLIHQQLSGAALGGILTGLFSCCNLALLFYYSPSLAAAGLALIGIAILCNLILAWLLLRTQRKWLALQGKLSGLVMEMLSGIAKLRVAAGEARAFGRWARQFSQARRLYMRTRRLDAFSEIFLVSFAVLANAALFYLVGSDSSEKQATTGEFIAFCAAFTGFFLHFMELSATLMSVLQVLPLLERARPILETEVESAQQRTHPGTLSGQITVSNLVFAYPQQTHPVLDGVSFAALPGQFIAIVGPSGSGKSTLLRLLIGFDKPTSGSVYYDGHDLAELDLQSVRSQLGVVLQSGQLMAGDIFSNIIGAHNLTRDDAWAAARMCGLDADIEAMPMGMHTVLGEGASTISGGQRQRILIARAIVRQPRILLFDEATSALDNKTQAQVSHSIERLKATRIVIAHRLSTIIHADLILVMDQGRIVQTGNYQELLAQPGLFQELARRQLA